MYKLGSSKDELMRFACESGLFSTKDVMTEFNLPYTSARDLLISLVSAGYLDSKSPVVKGECAVWQSTGAYQPRVIVGSPVNIRDFKRKGYDNKPCTLVSHGKPVAVVVPYDEWIKKIPWYRMTPGYN